MKHSEFYNVNSHDTDLNGLMTPTGYMRYMQDAVNFQMQKMTPSYAELLKEHLSFVLSRIKINVFAPVYSHDEIESVTWASNASRGVSFARYYEMKKKEEVIAQASSVWALLNTESGKLVRVSDFGAPYGSDAPLEIDMPRRMKVSDKLEKVGEKTVFYGDVDMNVHMNNTVYADTLWNFVPDFRKKCLKSIDISYISEAPLGEVLEIFMGECENGYFFRTVRKDGKTNVEAVIEASELN